MKPVQTAELILIIGVMGALAKLSPGEDNSPRALPQNTQLVSDELQNALVERRLEYKDSAWPRDIDKTRVDKSRVADEVLTRTSQWLSTMIKSKYLPKDVNNWLIPIRKPKPGFYKVDEAPDGTVRRTHIPEEGFDDYLVMRYSVSGHRLQIQENGPAIRLLIDVNDPVLFSPKIEQFIANVLYEFLNYPEAHKDALKFNLATFDHDARTIWFGVVDCDFNIQDSEARARRIWWNHTSTWTDGRRIYLSMVKMDGQPRKPTQPRPGIPPRFK